MQKWKVICNGEVIAELKNKKEATREAKFWHKVNGKEYKVEKPGK